MDFLIRAAVEKDYEGLNVLFEEIDEYHRKALPQIFRKPDGPARKLDYIAGILSDQNSVIFIAEIQNQIIGLVHAFIRSYPEISIRIPSRICETDSLIVKDKYRRSGIGKALMEKVQQWAVQMQVDRLELTVWDFNKEAKNFYRELDYEPAIIKMWKNR
jgi:GNAT superfamily N-acetyltransferase